MLYLGGSIAGIAGGAVYGTCLGMGLEPPVTRTWASRACPETCGPLAMIRTTDIPSWEAGALFRRSGSGRRD